MKKALLLTGVLLALCASYALAAPSGLNLCWASAFGINEECPSLGTNLSDMTDPCTSTSKKHYQVASLVAPAGLTTVTAEDVFIDLQVAAPVLDQYWHLENGGCAFVNGPNLSATNDFSLANGGPACTDYWSRQPGQGSFNWTSGLGGPNRARLEGLWAVQASLAGPMNAGTEYYLCWVLYKQLQLTQCPGCQDPGCFVLNQATISQPGGDTAITNQSTRQYVTWQGGANTVCPTSTPTRKSTWGEVKSLYR
jgi:hypothetical protein